MRPDIVPGATLPDYELPDQEDVPRRLSELQGDDPMIPHTLVLDWDLRAPGLREAWEAGDVSAFHGWNKWDAGKPVAAGKVASTR